MKAQISRVAVVALLAFARVATAGPSTAEGKSAADHFKSAKKMIDEKRYDEAIAELEAAYDLDPQPEHLYNLGVAHHLRGDDAIAVEYYRLYLLDAAPTKKEAVSATRYLDSLEKKLAAARAEKQQKDLAEIQAKTAQSGNSTAEVLLFAQYTSDAEAREKQLAVVDDEIHAVETEESAAKKRTSDLRAATTSELARAQRWERHARQAPSGDGRGRRVFGTILLALGSAATTIGAQDLLVREAGVHIDDHADLYMTAGAGALLTGLLIFVWGESASTDPREGSTFHLAPTVSGQGAGMVLSASW